ncbi:MAG: N-acetylmuramoyl-L-alanine amidase, partial [Hyphomicrobiaceae bacterium]
AYAAESLVVATAIGQKLKQAGLTPTPHHAEPISGENRPWVSKELGVYAAPFVVLRQANMPAVLFEVGIIVNRSEEKQLEDADRRGRIQVAILDALSPMCPAR